MFGSAPYRLLVALGGGNMPGRFVLGNFIGMQPEAEVGRQLQLLLNLDDDEHLERYHEVEDWFKYTQDIPGTFYLWLVEHLFRHNELIRGALLVGGQRVDMRDITCPLFLLAGKTDHARRCAITGRFCWRPCTSCRCPGAPTPRRRAGGRKPPPHGARARSCRRTDRGRERARGPLVVAACPRSGSWYGMLFP